MAVSNRPPAGRRAKRHDGMTPDRHRAVASRLLAIRDELLTLTASVAAAYPRTAKTRRAARAVVSPVDALRRELAARLDAEHPAQDAGRVYGVPYLAAEANVQ